MKTLKLVLKKKWYDMIASGEKKGEYREMKEYWINRLADDALPPFFERRYATVTFYLGYAKDRPSMSFKIESITIGKGKTEWGAEPGKDYFVIKLGERILEESK